MENFATEFRQKKRFRSENCYRFPLPAVWSFPPILLENGLENLADKIPRRQFGVLFHQGFSVNLCAALCATWRRWQNNFEALQVSSQQQKSRSTLPIGPRDFSEDQTFSKFKITAGRNFAERLPITDTLNSNLYEDILHLLRNCPRTS